MSYDCAFHPERYCNRGTLCAPDAHPDDPDWVLVHPVREVDDLRLRHRAAEHLLKHLVGEPRRVLATTSSMKATRVVREILAGAWAEGLRAVVRDDLISAQEAYASVTWVHLVDDDGLIDLWGSPQIAVFVRTCSDQSTHCDPDCDEPVPEHPTIRSAFHVKEVPDADIYDHLVRWSSFANKALLRQYLSRASFNRWVLNDYQGVGEVDIDATHLKPYVPPDGTSSHLNVAVRLAPLRDDLPSLVIRLPVACHRRLKEHDVRGYLLSHRRVAVLRVGARLIGQFV